MSKKNHVFMLQDARDSVLTNATRCKRHLSSNGECYICLNYTEDILHFLRNCKESSEIWLYFLSPNLSHSFFSYHLRERLDYNFTNRVILSFFEDLREKFATICCWLWKWRNNHILNNNVTIKCICFRFSCIICTYDERFFAFKYRGRAKHSR